MEKIGISRVVIPKITTTQMIEVDRLMMEDYKISLIQMMENAGRCLAILAIEKFLKKEYQSYCLPIAKSYFPLENPKE